MDRVLVVDDSRLNRNLLGSILKKAGYAVDACKDGIEAIGALERERDYAVLVFDLKMPVFSGIQLIDYLASGLPHLLNRVIVITAFPDMAAKLNKPVFAVMSHPIESEALVAVVKRCLEARRS
ncbi:MAG TPA: response regulator [Thermoanaerobaculia bacterium]